MRIGRQRLPADVTAPQGSSGLVIFAHGSGSSRLSPRNQQVAHALNQAGLATMLFDLLTEEEEGDRRNVFDIPLLAERMAEAIAAARGSTALGALQISLFGASTGAAAALRAAAKDGHIAAIVSRGGRPDLAGQSMAAVTAPTLLIVGALDEAVLALNVEAFSRLRCEKRLEIVPGATHLFEEPGAMEQVTELAVRWFSSHFGEGAA